MMREPSNPRQPAVAKAQLLRSVLTVVALLTTAGSLAAAPAKASSGARTARPAALEAPAPAGAEVRQSRCGEEDALPSSSGRDASMIDTAVVDPRTQLQQLVQRALDRSQSIGAVTLLAQAARNDWEETRASRLPQVNLGGTLAQTGVKSGDLPLTSGSKGTISVNVSAPLFDSGRLEKLAAWRSQLAESARLGLISAEQQLALQTVALAMDRSRFQLQIQIYGQYVRKMACLVDALEIIVKADRGRSSELVQAQKNRQQAELSVEQTHSALRQTEIRLKRMVGDELPPSASYSALLTQVPDLAEMQRDIESSPEVAQLAAQQQAQSRYAESVAASYRPQVNLLLNGAAIAGQGKGADVLAGVNVSMPLFNASADPAISAARKRAEAVRLQREDTIEARRYRLADIHESALSAFDRSRRIVEILRGSDRLRAATLQQWQQLGRRSLFDVMGSEADYYSLRVAHVNAIFDGQQAVALMWSMGRGVMTPLR